MLTFSPTITTDTNFAVPNEDSPAIKVTPTIIKLENSRVFVKPDDKLEAGIIAGVLKELVDVQFEDTLFEDYSIASEIRIIIEKALDGIDRDSYFANTAVFNLVTLLTNEIKELWMMDKQNRYSDILENIEILINKEKVELKDSLTELVFAWLKAH